MKYLYGMLFFSITIFAMNKEICEGEKISESEKKIICDSLKRNGIVNLSEQPFDIQKSHHNQYFINVGALRFMASIHQSYGCSIFSIARRSSDEQ